MHLSPRLTARHTCNHEKAVGDCAISDTRLDNSHFTYLHQQDYFQWETYLAFLEQVVVPAFYRRRHRIYLIQDNASYHKKQETYDWFKSNRRYVEVFQLPPYWPELNATERIWNYTRKHVTHNRFFEQPQDLCGALYRNFDYVRHNLQEIENLLRALFNQHVELIMCGYIATHHNSPARLAVRGSMVTTRQSIPVDNPTMLDHPIVRLATGAIVADLRSEVFQGTFDRVLLKMLDVAVQWKWDCAADRACERIRAGNAPGDN